MLFFFFLFFINFFTAIYPNKPPIGAKTHAPLIKTIVPKNFPAIPKEPPNVAPITEPPIAPTVFFETIFSVVLVIDEFFNSVIFLRASSFFANRSAAFFDALSLPQLIFFFVH